MKELGVTMSEELQIHFYFGSQGYDVDLKQDTTHNINSVVIGGITYSLHGNHEGIEIVKRCFKNLPIDSKMNLGQVAKELKSRMWLEGAKNITLLSTQSTHKLGMSILGENEQIDIPAIINEVCDFFEKNYVFPEIAEKCTGYLKDQMKQGAYDGITDGDAFTEAVLADLRMIAEDKHIDFFINPAASNKKPIETPLITNSSNPAIEQYTIPTVLSPFTYKAETDLGWMGGSANRFPYEIRTGYLDHDHKIGYIDFRIFGVTSAIDVEPQRIDSLARQQAIIKAMQNINQAESIIVDLRNNGGGDPGTVQLLCSLFIEEGLPLNTIVHRSESPRDYTTLPHTTLSKEQRLTESKLFVLIGPKTFSAAEEFSNNIKVLNRGKIIGEPSGGGANPGAPILIGDGDKFILFIPTGKAVNPIQKGNWEGVGIIPDEFVPAEKALDQAILLITFKV